MDSKYIDRDNKLFKIIGFNNNVFWVVATNYSDAEMKFLDDDSSKEIKSISEIIGYIYI